MSHRSLGMDHSLYPYSAMPRRAPLRWPGGARVMATVVLYFEHWELDPPQDSYRDPRTRDPITDLHPAYRAYSWREYGNRVGIFRILELLDRLRLPATVAANGAACGLYPQLVEEFVRRGYEFAAHGDYASRMITSDMSPDDERALIGRSLDQVEQACGQRPTGWVGQDYGESVRTPALLAEAGLQYLMDWPNDDQPYWMTVGEGLVSIPIHAEWEDSQALYARKILPGRYPDLVNEALDQFLDEGLRSGRYFSLHIHPWLLGKPYCFIHLERALERLVARDGVTWTTAAQVNTAFRAAVHAP